MVATMNCLWSRDGKNERLVWAFSQEKFAEVCPAAAEPQRLRNVVTATAIKIHGRKRIAVSTQREMPIKRADVALATGTEEQLMIINESLTN
jgi:hypothetical protein